MREWVVIQSTRDGVVFNVTTGIRAEDKAGARAVFDDMHRRGDGTLGVVSIFTTESLHRHING